MLSLDDEHPFSTMSCILGNEMFKDGTDLEEFKVRMIFRNMKSFAWALQDFCIQEGFQDKRVKFERRKILFHCYASKCLFKIYASLQRHCECFQIRSFHNIHTCEGIVKNPEATTTWIVRKYWSKIIANPSFYMDNMVMLA